MTVTFATDRRLWLINTPTFAYAARIDPGLGVRHVHWGAPIDLVTARALAEAAPGPAANSFEQGSGIAELPVEGGDRFGPAALIVRFPDGTRAVEWEYRDHEIGEDELAIRLADRFYPLEIVLHYRARGGALQRRPGPCRTGRTTGSATWSAPGTASSGSAGSGCRWRRRC
jgi:alpha-galactosidase